MKSMQFWFSDDSSDGNCSMVLLASGVIRRRRASIQTMEVPILSWGAMKRNTFLSSLKFRCNGCLLQKRASAEQKTASALSIRLPRSSIGVCVGLEC
jgi:hypothetical protein